MEATSQRLLEEGQLYPSAAAEEQLLLDDEDAAYEACPPALLLALLARAAREVASGNGTRRWMDAFDTWNGLTWTAPLAWRNLQDPLVRTSLQAAALQLNVLHALVYRPMDVCSKFIRHLGLLVDEAAGLSLTVAHGSSQNLQSYGTLAQTALVIASHGGKAEGCDTALLLAHVFTARRLLDLRQRLGIKHARAAAAMLQQLTPRAGELWSQVLHGLDAGFQAQQHWLSEAAVPGGPPAPVAGPLGTLAIWERGVASTFSEGPKDPVLERLFGLVGVTDRYYVEIGTQVGEQCNTRYLRVRYGFRGLMLDDNFQNLEVNLRRHRVTPTNVLELFQDYAVPRSFDLLSLDTDGNEWLLWLTLLQGNFLPRVVVIEFSPNLPYDQDLLVRYTPFPVHRLCLSSLQRLPRLAGGSVAGLLALGRKWGYNLVHLVGGGTTDLIFVRGDVLDEKGLVFPAQDNPHGLCALAQFQTGPEQEAFCLPSWPAGQSAPLLELFTTASAALEGDYELPAGRWSPGQLQELLC